MDSKSRRASPPLELIDQRGGAAGIPELVRRLRPKQQAVIREFRRLDTAQCCGGGLPVSAGGAALRRSRYQWPVVRTVSQRLVEDGVGLGVPSRQVEETDQVGRDVATLRGGFPRLEPIPGLRGQLRRPLDVALAFRRHGVRERQSVERRERLHQRFRDGGQGAPVFRRRGERLFRQLPVGRGVPRRVRAHRQVQLDLSVLEEVARPAQHCV